MQALKLFLRLIRPHFLIGAMLFYVLGAGVAKFLGASIHWPLLILGQVWVTLVQLSTHLLNEYFDARADQQNPNRTLFSGGSGAIGPGKIRREVALWAAITCLTVAASVTVLLMRLIPGNYGVFFVLTLIFLGAFFYSSPPLRLVSSGYGELVASIIVANLVPTLAFLLQHDEMHRLLAMATFPLIPLHLAMMLVFELPDYATDTKYEKRTLLVRIGWQRGMLMHNLMILIAYLMLGIAAIFGLPLSIAIPGLLSLPLGFFQIWMINRIADGAKPNWKILTFTSASILGVTAYLLLFTFWTR